MFYWSQHEVLSLEQSQNEKLIKLEQEVTRLEDTVNELEVRNERLGNENELL